MADAQHPDIAARLTMIAEKMPPGILDEDELGVLYVAADALITRPVEDDGVWENLIQVCNQRDAAIQHMADKDAEIARLAREKASAEQETARLREVVVASRDRFREYERLHAAKPDMDKARRNAEMAEMCERALAAAATSRSA